jgi:hypothetical protein
LYLEQLNILFFLKLILLFVCIFIKIGSSSAKRKRRGGEVSTSTNGQQQQQQDTTTDDSESEYPYSHKSTRLDSLVEASVTTMQHNEALQQLRSIFQDNYSEAQILDALKKANGNVEDASGYLLVFHNTI